LSADGFELGGKIVVHRVFGRRRRNHLL